MGNVFDPAGLFSSGSSPSLPSSGQIGSQYLDLINAFGTGDPTLLSQQEQYQPQFENLDLSGFNQALNGGNGQPGYLADYTGSILPSLTDATNAANTATRTAGVGDLAALGPAATAAIGAANPANTALMNALTKTATGQLNLGTQLDPASVDQINQSVNTNWANRGLGASGGAQLDNALQLYAGGQNLLSQREGEAGTVANENANLYEDPVLSMLGITSSAPGQAPSVAGAGMNLTSTAMPSMNPSDALSTAYNASASNNIDAANVANQGTGLQQTLRSY